MRTILWHTVISLWKRHRRALFVSFVQTPLGVVFLLVWIWGVDVVIKLLPFQFPSPIVTMLMLFALLLILGTLPVFLRRTANKIRQRPEQRCSFTDNNDNHKTPLQWFLIVMGPSLTFLTAYMPMFFTPSFILIPGREILGGKAIGLIIAWFIPSFVLAWMFTVYLCKATSLVPFFQRQHAATTSKEDDIHPGQPRTFSISSPHHENNAERVHDDVKVEKSDYVVGVTQIVPESQTSCEQVDMLNSQSGIITQVLGSDREVNDDRPLSVEDIEIVNDNVGRSELSYVPSRHDSASISRGVDLARVQSFWGSTDVTRAPSPQPIAVDSADAVDTRPQTAVTVTAPDILGWQDEKLPCPVTSPDSPSDLIVQALQPWVDPFIYMLIFVLGLFIFYFPPSGVTGRALPLFLSLNSLTYLFSVRVVPEVWKKVLHPILVCSIATCLGIWGFGATVGWSIKESLDAYSTSTTYIELFRPDVWNDGGSRGPGAGDVLMSLLDAGIVSLALPLYKYREDMKTHFLQMACIILPSCMLSLFFWPLIPGTLVMGLPWQRAVAFAGRFMSTPLAIELVTATGGDQSLTVVLVVVTGIVAVLLKDHLFRWMKVSDQDTLTIGMTIGVIAGAIGTSSLLKTNQRAMASATVGFVGFGLVLLCLVAVPAIAQLVRTVAGG